MRMNTDKTHDFFQNSNLNYIDKTEIIDSSTVHYIQTGNNENPTLFFVHGSPGSWDAYKDYLKDTLLLKKYRMIAVDRPGFGYSDFGKSKNLYNQSKLLIKLVEKLNNKKAIILVGHSYGGPIIVKMASLQPKLFSDLVILSGAIDPNAENPEKWRPIIMGKPIRYLIPGALRPANDELWWLKEDLITMKPNLKNIKSKIYVIHGTKDPLVPYSNMAFIQKQFVNAKSMDTISIKNANHFIPWEHFELIRNVLYDLKIEN
ncbi:alpha/beta hydrolase [Flavobacterium sp. SUN052]|nr:alpha/beta hydrolase [Flavobacterium sp. SUN052]